MSSALSTGIRRRLSALCVHLGGRRLAVGLLLTLSLATLWTISAVAGETQSIPARLAAKSLLLDAEAAGERIVVVGERGHLLVSDSGGDDWRQVVVPTRATLTAVRFFQSRLGLAVGHDAVILRTQDGGDSWARVHYAPQEERPLLDVWFRDAEHAVAVGAYGYYLESRDAGRTWTPRDIKTRVVTDDDDAPGLPADELPDDYHLNRIAFSETRRLYMAAEAGNFYRSEDLGATWTRLPTPYEGSYFGVLPLDGDVLLLFGLQGRLFRSADAGISWRHIETGTGAALTDGIRLSDESILLVGFSGTLLIGGGDGKKFTLRQQGGRAAIASVVESADGHVIFAGEGGVRRIGPEDYRPSPSS